MSQIKSLSQVRREHIVKVLNATDGDQTQACEVLGITLAQLRRLIDLHRIETPSPEPGPQPSPSPSRQKE